MQGKGELTISNPAALQAALSDLAKERGHLRDIKFHRMTF